MIHLTRRKLSLNKLEEICNGLGCWEFAFHEKQQVHRVGSCTKVKGILNTNV